MQDEGFPIIYSAKRSDSSHKGKEAAKEDCLAIPPFLRKKLKEANLEWGIKPGKI